MLLRRLVSTHLFKMSEVQRHGFSWEKDLMRNVYGATEEEIKSIKYTEKVDLPAFCNHLDSVGVSIKTTCSPNTICMGDSLRVYDSVSSDTPIHMTVIKYIQDDERKVKKIETITEVNLTQANHILFGSLTRADIESLDTLVKKIPQKRKPSEEEKKALYALQTELQKKSGAIYLNIKCNSQQSRLQCSFNKFQEFLITNTDRIVAQSKTNEFRGKTIQAEVASGRRQFKRAQPVTDSAPHLSQT